MSELMDLKNTSTILNEIYLEYFFKKSGLQTEFEYPYLIPPKKISKQDFYQLLENKNFFE